MDYSNIPTGLKITSQIPLNSKEWVKDESTLAYLGVDDNLAFTYHDQLEVFCLAEKTLYIWREVQPGEENTGLIPLDFTYPNSLSEIYGIDYSGKTYNFFLKKYLTSEDVLELIQIENVGIGFEIYKGFNTNNNKHEIKTITSKDNSLLIKDNQTTLDFKVYNNQKIINDFPYTLQNVDDKFTLFLNNNTSNITINIPDNLNDNFCCTFIQKGTGEVAVITTGTSSLSYPSTLQNVIKGQNYWALIEKELNLNNYFLIGSLKTV